MSLIINNNLMAANAARNLSVSFGDLAVSVRRLSSGLRVDTSADDAAGLAIRELMRADITALNQGVRNANDAISLIQTADGALGVIDEKLIRMKELAEQAATGTYNSDQRLILDSEYQAMAHEITRIADSTDFNGLHLLNGNLSGTTHDGSGLVSSGKLKVHFGSGNDSAEDYYYIQINSATASALGLSGSATTEAGYVAENNLIYDTQAVFNAGNFAQYTLVPQSVRDQFAADAVATRYYDATGDYPYYFIDDTNGDRHMIRFYQDKYLGDTNLADAGAAAISTQHAAQAALDTIRTAIVSKDKIRAGLGALQNRLENTVSNLQIQAENLQAAESRISDVDVSLEMTNFVRNQIKSQAAVSMLAQANSLPRMAMQLLGG